MNNLFIDERQLLVLARGLYTTSRCDTETEAKLPPTVKIVINYVVIMEISVFANK
jgi:hypothetical protein